MSTRDRPSSGVRDAGASPRQRFSTQVSEDVQARVRATVRGMTTAFSPDYSLAAFTEEALNAYCGRLEAKYNNKTPWPSSSRPLRPGPRIA